MEIKTIKVGKLKCNCYILINEDNALVIDPGDDTEKIIKLIDDKKVLGVIVTHHHFDHDTGVDEILNKYKCEMYDRYNLSEGNNKIGEFEFETIYTPGHKEDLITIYFREDKVMFCGDFIFKDSIGRCDLPGSSIPDMIKSLDKIKKYDKDITIYPGHGIKTSLGYEIDNNVYFREFV